MGTPRLDITRRKHRGSATSVEPFDCNAEKFESAREMVWHKLRLHPLGLTSKELALHFDVPLHSISGRITELKLAGRVLRTPERRDGCGVLVAMAPNSDLLAGVLPRVEITAEVR